MAHAHTNYSACHRKVRHKSESKARIALRGMVKRGMDTNGLRPYKCRGCGRWHLGRP